ncbi:phenylalanine 4-monooxygenase [Henriciella marina]|uniref:phenylalanine 4-monooxygenase n=1 Tax=Henriciella marina TaxID=453851 RepID=UPI000377104F|nr:phenylalanine 4-monooxygenase [Henriciella marina]
MSNHSERPAHARADWTIDQGWSDYTAEEHAVWDILYKRQMDVLPGRAAPEFLDGLKALDLGKGGIPEFEAMSDELEALTGWRVVAVPGLVPDEVFFDHLANRRFPAGQFIRKRNQLDYLQEPDVFHDVFGHVPMLTNPVFADYMEAYGKGGLRSLDFAALKNLAALYWYTVEFGLIQTDEGLRIYGAGIVSSKTESIFALEDPSPNRIGFELERLMKTDYRIDDFQQTYFVIDSYEQLFDATVKTDFAPIYDKMQGNFELKPEDIEASDTVLHRGSQAYAEAGGRLAPVGSGK